MTKWPPVDLGKIFAYILSNKEFDSDYIGKYKDEKAYYCWKSNFRYHPLCRQQGWKVCVAMQGNSIAAHQRGPKRSLGSPQERWNCLVWLVHMHCWHECNMQPHNCIALQDGICIHPWLYRSIMYISPLRMECINQERCAARKDNGHANQKRQENNWK